MWYLLWTDQGYANYSLQTVIIFSKNEGGKRNMLDIVFKFSNNCSILYITTYERCLNLVSKLMKLCISASHFEIHYETRPLDSKQRFTQHIRISDSTPCSLLATDTFCQTAQCPISAEGILHTYCHENLKSHINFSQLQRQYCIYTSLWKNLY